LAHKIQNRRVSEECTLSDHNLILFNLKTLHHKSHPKRTTNHPTRKFATQVGNWNQFQQIVSQSRQQWVDLVNNSAAKEQLDTAITTTWGDLGEISKRCFPPFSPKTKYVPWWSPKLNTLRKQVNTLKRRVKRCNNSSLREIYGTRLQELKHLYKTEILTAKQDSWKKFCTDVKSTSWKIYKMCKEGFARHPIPSSLTLLDRSISTSAKETANAMLHKFFPDDPIEQDSVQQRNSREQALGSVPPDSQATPDFRNHEVEEVIRNLQDKKSPGPDGIDGVIVKRIHKILPTFWATIFNKCFLLGCFPKVWKEARVTAIPKTDKANFTQHKATKALACYQSQAKAWKN
jgi:hypothetical protein